MYRWVIQEGNHNWQPGRRAGRARQCTTTNGIFHYTEHYGRVKEPERGASARPAAAGRRGRAAGTLGVVCHGASVEHQVLDDRAERQRREERQRADETTTADQQRDEQRRVRRQRARAGGGRLLGGQRAGDGEHRDGQPVAADEHGEAERQL